MTRDDVIRLAKEAGIEFIGECTPHTKGLEKWERFAALVAADTRERCAAECERMVMYPGGRQESAAHNDVWQAAKAIRALGDE